MTFLCKKTINERFYRAPDCNTRVSEVYRQAVTNLKDPEAVAAFKTSFESIYEKLWKPPMPNDL